MSDGNVLRGVTIQNFHDSGVMIWNGVTHNEISDCTVQHNGSTGFWVNGGLGGVQDNRIVNCLISSNTSEGIALKDSESNTIKGNTIEGNGSEGISIYGITGGSSDNTIEGNVIVGNDGGGIVLGDPGTNGNRIVANTIAQNGGEGITIFTGVIEIVILHNTVDSNVGRGISARSDATPIQVDIRNNIVSNNENCIVFIGESVGIVDYNLYFENDSYSLPAGSDVHSIVADPLYTADYHLTSCTSPAIDSGVDLGVDQPDLNGPPTPPPSSNGFDGDAPDMGAHETLCGTET